MTTRMDLPTTINLADASGNLFEGVPQSIRLQAPPHNAERTVDGGQAKLIARRETLDHMLGPRPLRGGAAAVAVAFVLTACSSASSDQPDNLAAIDAIRTHRSGQEVTVEGTVAQTPHVSRSATGRHEDFLIEVSSGAGEQQLIQVAHNIDIAPEVPLEEGTDIIVRGELDIDRSGPVIHWTHHDPRGRHQPGFIRIKNGPTYD
jgi:hypothetical protein